MFQPNLDNIREMSTVYDSNEDTRSQTSAGDDPSIADMTYDENDTYAGSHTFAVYAHSEKELSYKDRIIMTTPQSKQGHKMCGFCCDMRRAVIIVNTISLSLGVIGIIGVIAAAAADGNGTFDSNGKAHQLFTGMDRATVGGAFALLIVYMLMNAAGIYGALTYSQYLVGFSLLGCCIDFVISLAFLNFGGAVFDMLFAYPHIVFLREVRNGVLSRDTYSTEKYSCCCI
jgi:hypothetical protein